MIVLQCMIAVDLHVSNLATQCDTVMSRCLLDGRNAIVSEVLFAVHFRTMLILESTLHRKAGQDEDHHIDTAPDHG